MPVVVLARADDEIADLIDLVRSAKDPEVGLVLPPGNRAFQTPLNARLLSQFSRQNGRRTAIVSDDARIQGLARANGFTVYSSVPAFERGIEAAVPRPPAFASPRSAEAVGAAAATTAPLGAGAWTTAATLQQPPPRSMPPPGPPPPGSTYPQPRGDQSGPPGGPLDAPPEGASGRERRRPLYYAAAAIAIVGLLLFFVLAPSAKISVTLAGTPLAVNPTIQGSTDPTQASQGDHILTSVAHATASQAFTATPSGQKTVNAAPASGIVTISTSNPNGIEETVPQGDSFQTADHSVTFVVTQPTYVCEGPNGQPPSVPCSSAPNSNVPVQDAAAEAKGNVPANTITYWPQNEQPAACQPQPPNNQDLCTVTNPQPTTGGADQKQFTVASASDVSSWNNQVTQIESALTNQVTSQLQSQAAGKTFAVDPGGGGKTLAFNVSPPIPAAGAAFSTSQVTVTANGTAAAYNPADVKQDLMADLKAQVSQGDQLAPNKFSAQPCQVTQAATDGTVILSCSATDFSQPIIDLTGLKSQLTGKNPGDANRIIQSDIDKVQNVTVSEFPFKLFYLPFFSSRIEIDENFVPLPSSS
jgi:hypothetical protein